MLHQKSVKAGRVDDEQETESSESLLRRHWGLLRRLLGRKVLCRDVANQLYETGVLKLQELERIEDAKGQDASDELLKILVRGSLDSCIIFARALCRVGVNDAELVGTYIQRDAGKPNR